jgi:tetratricopeptide (TPR) repeat protein
VDGRDIKRLFRRLHERRESLPQEFAVFIAHEVCKGLEYAHRLKNYKGESMGIVHQDISPSNVVLSFSGEVKVVDFGIANTLALTNETKDGINWGKVQYVAPERLQNQPATPQSDIFSLGVVLHEMLTGRGLFRAKDPKESARRILSGRYPKPSDLNPAVPAALDLLVARALSRNPRDRFADAGAMQEVLYEFLNHKNPQFVQKSMALYMQELFQAERRKQLGRLERGSQLAQEFHENLGDVFEVEAGSRGSLPIGSELLDALRNSGPIARDPNAVLELQETGILDDLAPPAHPASIGPGGGATLGVKSGPLPRDGSFVPEAPAYRGGSTTGSGTGTGSGPNRGSIGPASERKRAAHVHGVRPRQESASSPPPAWLPWALGAGLAVAVAAGVGVAVVSAPKDSLPAAELMTELSRTHGRVTEDPAVLVAQGWEALLSETPEGDQAARDAFELAAAADRDDPRALAGLAVAYARAGRWNPVDETQALDVLARARALGGAEVDLLRAQAGLSLAFDNPRPARVDAASCLAIEVHDLPCALFQAQAAVAEGQDAKGLDALAERVPEASGLQRALAARDLAQGHPDRVEDRLSALDDPASHIQLGQLYLRAGRIDDAREQVELATAAGAGRWPQLGHLSAELALVEGDPQRALTALAPFLDRADLGELDDGPELLVMASSACLALERSQRAEELALRAVEARRGWAPGHYALFSARAATGHPKTDEALENADLDALEPRERAAFHMGVGLHQLQQGKPRGAKVELAAAVRFAPNWLDARLALVVAHGSVDQWELAQEVLDMAWRYELDFQPGSPLIRVPHLDRSDLLAGLEATPGGAAQRAYVGVLIDTAMCVDQGGCPATARTLDAGLGSHLGWRARLALANDQPERAYALLDPLGETDAAVLELRAMALAMQDRPAEAEVYMDRAWAAERLPGMARRRADLLQTVGDTERATAFAQDALAENGWDATAYGLLMPQDAP